MAFADKTNVLIDSTARKVPESTTVCIVGAGPTGLACALGLQAKGVSFVIVDALGAGHNSSRAMGVQPAGMEAIHALSPPLAAALIADGVPCATFRTCDVYGRDIARVTFGILAAYTKFPFALVLPQHKFELRMREALTQPVYWQKRVSGLREVADGAAYELIFDSGEIIRAQYVVAADGSNSTIRTLAAIPFVNPNTGHVSAASPADPAFIVADVRLASPIPPTIPIDAVQVMIGGGGMVLSAPLRTDTADATHSLDSFRIYFGLPGPEIPPKHPSREYLQALLAARGPGSHAPKPSEAVPQIAEVFDSTRYRTRSALAARYAVFSASGAAHVLLAGDAAHKHSPAGGQGMTLGICDGAALANAITQHVSRGGGSALAQYEVQRRAVARKVIAIVDQITEVECGKDDWVAWGRSYLIWALMKFPLVRKTMAWRMSGLGDIHTMEVKSG